MNGSTYTKDLVGRLREARLPRAPWGFRTAATRHVLEEAARRLESLEEENVRLRVQATQRERTPVELPAPVEKHEDAGETIGRALLAASRTADEMLEEARQEAERKLAEANGVADELLRRAQEEVDGAADRARAELALIHEQGRYLLDGVSSLRDALAAFCVETEPSAPLAVEDGHVLQELRLPAGAQSSNGTT